MEEIWKAIPGHPGYEASDQGRIRSLDRTILCKDGRRFNVLGRILIPNIVGGGYHAVKLQNNVRVGVHRLVLMAFIGNPHDKFEACHNDGDKTNNSLNNLRWGTHISNCTDRSIHGASPTKLTVAMVEAIRRDHRKYSEISIDYGVSPESISHVKRRKTWRHI